jgi:hypothetical protein
LHNRPTLAGPLNVARVFGSSDTKPLAGFRRIGGELTALLARQSRAAPDELPTRVRRNCEGGIHTELRDCGIRDPDEHILKPQRPCKLAQRQCPPAFLSRKPELVV